MIVVDSSVWIDFFNGQTTKETRYLLNILGKEQIIVGDIILSEVLQGFRTDASFKKAKEILSQFLFQEMLGEKIALASARNYRTLRARGLTVRSTIDSLIATYCIENNLPLLHSDKDYQLFEKFCGLRTI
jgi:predicted nucleic acid-binding protein